MPRLTAARRRKIPKSQFEVPGGVRGHKGPSFPEDTAAHDESAIKLAPKSLAAGNISQSTEERIVADAKRKLGRSTTPTPKTAPKADAPTRKANFARIAAARVSGRKAMGF